MQQEDERLVNADQSITFLHCVWPPTPAATPDGYTKIILKNADLPRQANAPTANVADRIIGPCANYSLSYSVFSQGNTRHLPPFNVRRHAIVRADDPTIAFTQPLPFAQERPETDVVHDGTYTL